MEVSRLTPDSVISVVYFEGEKEWSMIKRFAVETSKADTKYPFISESGGSKLYFATSSDNPIVKYSHKSGGTKQEEEVNLAEFIDVKGWKAGGNKVGEYKILKIEHLNPPKPEDLMDKDETPSKDGGADLFSQGKETPTAKKKNLKPGDSIDLDL